MGGYVPAELESAFLLLQTTAAGIFKLRRLKEGDLKLMHPVETNLRELKAPAGQNSAAVLLKCLLSTERAAKMMGSHRNPAKRGTGRMGYEEMWVTGLRLIEDFCL